MTPNAIRTLAPLTGFSQGRALTNGYRAVLTQRDGKPVIAVEEEIDGHWYSTGGRWYLHTLAARDHKSDRIAIDYGRGWFVEGINAAITEAAHWTVTEDCTTITGGN